MDQIAAHFGRDAHRISAYELVLRIGKYVVGLQVRSYMRPTTLSPSTPHIWRIGTVAARQLILSKRHFKRILDSAGPQACQADWRLEFTVLPDELMALSGVICLRLERMAYNRVMSGAKLLKRARSSAQAIFRSPDMWLATEYLWSSRADKLQRHWEQLERYQGESSTQSNVPRLEERFQPLTLARPSYVTPTSFPRWVNQQQVSTSEVLAADGTVPTVLQGQQVERELSDAAKRGYIVLPNTYNHEQRWIAWRTTWSKLCRLERHRWPVICLYVWERVGPFGRRIALEWDWITASNDSVPGDWDGVIDRIHAYYDSLRRSLRQALFSKHASVSGSASGYMLATTEFDKPIRWVFEWLRSSPLWDSAAPQV